MQLSQSQHLGLYLLYKCNSTELNKLSVYTSVVILFQKNLPTVGSAASALLHIEELA